MLATTLGELALPDAFETALAFTLREEGCRFDANGCVTDSGRVDDPDDPGGRTAFGITQATYSAWKASHGDTPDGDVWGIGLETVAAIYQARYWNDSRANQVAAAGRKRLALATFDWAVNGSIVRGKRYLQASVNATVDGIVGPQTIAAVIRCDETLGVAHYCRLRAAHYHVRAATPQYDAALALLTANGLASIAPTPNPSQQKFLKDWLVRVQHVAHECGLTTFDALYAPGAWET